MGYQLRNYDPEKNDEIVKLIEVQNILSEKIFLAYKVIFLVLAISEEQLKMLVYRDIKIFKMDCIDILHTAACMVKNSQGHLREISLNYNEPYLYEDDFNENSLIFISAIYENLFNYLSRISLNLKNY